MSYLMAGQLSGIERLWLQSRMWEPAGERLLTSLGDGSGQRVLEVGCGVMGWLGCLSHWVGERGVVIGTDLANNLLDAARLFCAESGLPNVTLLQDDFFATQLEEASFDLVHL
jgi:ubiquinone/menaquinone biosynthesis C-methylase UbiE